MSRAVVREGMFDVYVALGQLKRTGKQPHLHHVEREPLTGSALVNAFMQINPSRVKAATP